MPHQAVRESLWLRSSRGLLDHLQDARAVGASRLGCSWASSKGEEEGIFLGDSERGLMPSLWSSLLETGEKIKRVRGFLPCTSRISGKQQAETALH